MNISKYIICAAMVGSSTLAMAQERLTVSGVILDDKQQPVADAVLISPGHGIVRSDEQGKFSFSKGLPQWSTVRVQANGFFVKEILVKDNLEGLDVYLIPENSRNYNQTILTGMSANEENVEHTFGLQNAARKDFRLNALSLDNALADKFTGLQTLSKGGMPGEGSYLSVRGVRSLLSETNPLLVINGIPFMPDQKESMLLKSYSRSLFQSINPQDIANVTLLTGAAASQWGSLGSNGVLLIETTTPKSDNLDTRVTFSGNFGLNWQDLRLPLMNASEYKSYLSDIGMSYYGNDMESFFSDFGFMSSPTANMAHLYTFDTDWQDEIYRNASTQDYLFRVEGGDAIAKYNISLGYTGDQGTLKNTKSDRFNAQINANVLVSKKWEINASINLAYLNGRYQEQGYSLETNPLLAAYRRAPILSPYKAGTVPNEDGSYALINKYSSYYLGSVENTDFIVSNPLSLVDHADGSLRQYDFNSRMQLVYNLSSDLSLQATVGLYSNYDKEKLFVPGIDNNDVVPRFDAYGEIDNSVKVGQGNVFNFYWSLSGQYRHTFAAIHKVSAKAGFQMWKSSSEFDMSDGRNTPNDSYQTQGNTQSVGKFFAGYNSKWNWLDLYAQADYRFADLAAAGVHFSVDGASSVGSDSQRLALYPGVNAAVMLANFDFLASQRSWLDQLDLYADYSVTGNSRYSSKLGQYYYTSKPYQSIAGIVRANVPNTHLVPERDFTTQVGVEVAALHHALRAKVGLYKTDAKDVLMMGRNSSALGTSPYYCNEAEIRNRGLEASLSYVAFQNRDWRVTLGGNITTLCSEVRSLGSLNDYITTLGDKGEILTRVGENPYSFYGYETRGIYSTSADAAQICPATGKALTNRNGVTYQAGDVIYVDQNHDGIINDADKRVLGSATPDFYGSLFANVEYKGFSLDLTFGYSHGNEAYNAVRRLGESTSDFANQFKSVNRRWQNEGDITDMPRANYGDVIGNNDMSDRHIEDASFVKLRDITLSYTWNKKLFHAIQGGSVYVSGQNLLTFTDYLGMDPELSYSNSASMLGIDYGKVAAPKSVRVGVNLKF